jgi:hypothetical protein
MDPSENLKRQIELAELIIQHETVDAPDRVGEAAAELAELVIALDEWRRNGGFDPYRVISRQGANAPVE